MVARKIRKITTIQKAGQQPVLQVGTLPLLLAAGGIFSGKS